MNAPHRPRALLSVSDKTGIVELARALARAGVELVSTGGTASLLRGEGLDVTDVAEVTGQPELMDGRLKTLHPRVFGGLLARPSIASDLLALDMLGSARFHLVVVNLYPFRATIAQPGCTPGEAIEQIDIGGPSMIRAAAKNHRHVAVVVDPADYDQIADAASSDGGFRGLDRFALAAKAFRHTAAYDSIIAQYLTEHVSAPDDEHADFPEQLTITLDKVNDLRYGENPHQPAAFYALPTAGAGTLADAEQHQGKELSYNNIADVDAAIDILREFDEPAAVIVKHVNPCGVATGATALDAWHRALAADPISAFGGIVACNREVDGPVAEALCEIFLEVVIAPGYTDDALEVLARKPNLRVLEGADAGHSDDEAMGGGAAATVVATRAPVRAPGLAVSTVSGGMLVQHADAHRLEIAQLEVVTDVHPTQEQLDDLLFAWRVVKHVTSNAIVLAADGRTLGIGAGQMNRVGSARIAIDAAGAAAIGSALASDAFFPMPDSIELAARAGITSIVQPGGSRRDADVIAACDDAGIAMVFTNVRHFRH
jgi:phosphoribosylaminoimidazolecarboxamide formyltransferase/IMP cyclohydrolase